MICRKAISALVPQDSKQVKWPSKLQLKAFFLTTQNSSGFSFISPCKQHTSQNGQWGNLYYEDNLKTLDKTQY